MAAVARRRKYATGQTIYCQDEPAREVYRIVTGAVRLAVIRRDGREFLFGILKAGEIFGEATAIDRARRSNTAIAQGDIELDVISSPHFAEARARHREIDTALVQILTRRMRALAYYATANMDDLTNRVVIQLLVVARSSDIDDDAPLSRVIPITQSDLALMLGSARQSVNRVLQQLQATGLLNLSYRQIIVHDLTKLEEHIIPF